VNTLVLNKSSCYQDGKQQQQRAGHLLSVTIFGWCRSKENSTHVCVYFF